jgi:putative serine protease PepD
MPEGRQGQKVSPNGEPSGRCQSHRMAAARRWRGRVRPLAIRGLALAAISAAFGAAVALLALPPRIGTQLVVPSSAETQPAPESPVERIATEVLPSMVTLTTEQDDGEFHEGSGIIVSPDGLIMTNDHVVAAADDASQGPVRNLVTLNDGRAAPFSVVAADPKSDIAVVRVEGLSGLTPVLFGSSSGVSRK